MNKKLFFLFSVGLISFIVSSFVLDSKRDIISSNTKVSDLLISLGDKKPLHYISQEKRNKETIKKGFEIVTKGFTQHNGKKTKIQSKHFVCTDCHNIVQEDPDLSKNNPESRLDYAIEKNISFLPATTMAGVVNRETWYNDDYIKKYGSLVASARDTLRNAIHLCAVQCSQGRALNEWEMEAVVQYFLSIGHEIKDLKLSPKELKSVSDALKNKASKDNAIKTLKSKYMTYSPATFVYPEYYKDRKLGEKGDPKKGEKLYELSCLTCHKETGVTNHKLSKSALDLRHLKYWSGKDSFLSVYHAARKGTYSKNGYKPYMPNYTKERLSDQQLEDLVAYINTIAK